MATDYETIGRQTLQLLKDRIMEYVKDSSEVVYCDLGGLVLNAEQYCKKLDEDPEFAKEALNDIFAIAKPRSRSEDPRITVREQRSLARQVAQFYDKNGMKSSTFNDFLKSRPLIATVYCREDLARVVDTLRFEHRIFLTAPAQEFLDDVCRKNNLPPYKKE